VSTRKRKRPALAIAELAVDPADVDEGRYPVRIRLTRSLTPFEADRFAADEPDLRTEDDAIVVPHSKLDDVARDYQAWMHRLERVEALGLEQEGEALVADQRRADERVRHGSHLRSQHVNDRGLH
jgi:hypothetical protein